MAVAYKILGKSNPTATTQTQLYVVPSSTEAVVSTIIVCNQSATAGSFRIAVLQGGGTVAAEDYVYYDVPIDGNDTFAATFGITLAATDEIEVYASSGSMSFQAWGTEIT